jgi:hypothetical protein
MNKILSFYLFFFRILPDIPQNNDLFDDQTYIHFYIPSKTENRSIKKLHSSLFDKEKYSD